MEPGTRTVVICIVVTAVAGVVLTLRCISRVAVMRNSGADDVLAVLAYLSSLATTIFIYAQYQHGLGQDIDKVSPEELVHLLKYFWASLIAFGLGMTFLAISASAQYLRFMFQRKYWLLCWASIILNSILGVAALFVAIFTCVPIAYYWDKTITGGKCINIYLWWYIASAWIIVMAITLVVAPIYAVKNLNLPPASKSALVGVFALGGFECVTSVLRLYWTYVISRSTNITRDYSETHTWASLEVNIGIMCVSLPPLRALFSTIFSTGQSRKNDTSRNQAISSNDITASQPQSPRPDEPNSTDPKSKHSSFTIPDSPQEYTARRSRLSEDKSPILTHTIEMTRVTH